jgi:HEAT repeat protein
MRSTIHTTAALVVGCCLVTLAGCAATARNTGGLLAKAMGRRSTEEALNIKTPQDRALELAELAEAAAQKTPEEQSYITAQLADEIRTEEDPVMRRHILRALAAYPTPLALAILTAGLQDGDLEVRRAACLSLGRYGGPQAVGALTQAANSATDMDVRITAVRALGMTGDKLSLAPLTDALVDPDPAIQFRAQESLRAVSGRDFGGNVQAWREYAKTGDSTAAEISFAERLRQRFF